MSLEGLKRNGHRLELGNFELYGEYGIPILQPVQLDSRLNWLRFNHSLKAKERTDCGVHFFIDDYLFERAWHDPPRYALFLHRFAAVMTPDFSMFTDYPKAVQVYNHWRKHQLGAYWQSMGMTVIPTIGWLDKDSYSWCFDGEPMHSTVAVSSEEQGCQTAILGRLQRDDGTTSANKNHLLRRCSKGMHREYRAPLTPLRNVHPST